ncbi:hypothetical protein JXO59_04955, partial [candidate division KSB1 bacterium]|nr:hypothetical protein [candidate division KSB1 bacterium]
MNDAGIKSFAFILGCIAMTIQIVLLRSFLSVFYGNELLIGLLLSFWLIWSGAGSYLGNRMIRRPGVDIQRRIVYGLYFAILWTAVIIAASKWIRVILAIPGGEFINTTQFLLFAAPILAPSCFVLGLCFTLLAQLYFTSAKKATTPAATIYIYEAMGSTLGSLLFTFIWVQLLSHLQVLCLLWIVVSFLLAWLDARRRKIALAAGLLIAALSPLTDDLELTLAKIYYASLTPQMRLVESKTSRYGELAIVDWMGEKTLFANSLKGA